MEKTPVLVPYTSRYFGRGVRRRVVSSSHSVPSAQPPPRLQPLHARHTILCAAEGIRVILVACWTHGQDIVLRRHGINVVFENQSTP